MAAEVSLLHVVGPECTARLNFGPEVASRPERTERARVEMMHMQSVLWKRVTIVGQVEARCAWKY